MPPVIALLTDFGLSDPYVGQMKAVLARLIPQASVIDISHDVRPFDILQAAFFLAATAPHLPPGSLTVSVVDPGVGGPRRLIARSQAGLIHLAPDNGLLSLLPDGPTLDLTPLLPGEGSSTFHGRDILAPLAARLAEAPDLLRELPELTPQLLPDLLPTVAPGLIRTRVLHIDRFGNCVLTIRSADWPELRAASGLTAPSVAGQPLCPVRTYADLPPGGLGLLAGSQGFLEIAANQDSAARRLDLSPGDVLTLADLAT